MRQGDLVYHEQFGEGEVIYVTEVTVVARFGNAIHECLRGNLSERRRPRDLALLNQPEDAKNCLCKVMASAIRSINDEWGVFATSRVALLPHQLWVCRKTLETLPCRWLIADDVGLGKTIEAGLILLSMYSAKKLKRVLVLTPASLKEQWRDRMLDMFDLRFQIYNPADDKPKSKFWKTAQFVIASLETLRMNSDGRWKRLTDSGPWDMVIVDEAHRLNAEERDGGTLGYNFIKEMAKKDVINSLLFFTGTPHKGKDYNFFALLSLLRPDLFSPRHIRAGDIDKISQVMIRNNKQKVTDMKGRRLFTSVTVRRENFDYSESEINFYNRLTEYIERGLAFANDANAGARRIIHFVLLAMQKLAASSVAAVRSAIAKRIDNLKSSNALAPPGIEYAEIDDGEEESAERALKQAISQPEEMQALEELGSLADKVISETKISRIIEKIRILPEGESVLLFTEYKATQALLVSELRKNFGTECVAFINGDGALEIDGARESLRREKAAADFNRGAKRFLISTEAAGEGVDLQEHCHILFHVDLPWNPMRLHQRAGRLHRYGQKFPVEIYIFHNPDTVESRIWTLLEQKLVAITRAFQAMEDPEDMCLAVIGAKAPQFFNDLFLNARRIPKGGLKDWFDAETATFGGKQVISQIQEIFGNASRFDFQDAAGALPQADLEQLMPFIKLYLGRIGARSKVNRKGDGIGFDLPRQYMRKELNIADSYNLVFSRRATDEEEETAGLGHAIVDKFIREGEELPEKFAALPGLENPLFIFRIQDRSTENSASRQRIFGVELMPDGPALYRDWELLAFLNRYADKPRTLKNYIAPRLILEKEIEEATEFMKDQSSALKLPFSLPYVEEVAILIPGIKGKNLSNQEEGTCKGVSVNLQKSG